MNSFYSFIFLLFFLNFDKVLTVDSTCDQVKRSMGHTELMSCGRFRNRLFWIMRQDRFDLTQATDACKKLPNGNLASIRNEEENKYVYALGGFTEIFSNKASDLLTGLHRRSMNCSQPFVWTDGTEFDYADWKEGEPNCKPSNGTEKCVVLQYAETESYMPRYGWNDVSCQLAHPKRFLCAVTLTGEGSSTNA